MLRLAARSLSTSSSARAAAARLGPLNRVAVTTSSSSTTAIWSHAGVARRGVRSLNTQAPRTLLHTSAAASTSAHITQADPLPFGNDESSLFAPLDTFTRRHVGPAQAEVDKMLKVVGYDSLDAFADDVVPASIRIDEKTVSNANNMAPLSESEMLRRATELSEDNEVFRSFIGMGEYQRARLCHEQCTHPPAERVSLTVRSTTRVLLPPQHSGYHQAVVPPVILRKCVRMERSMVLLGA